MPLGISYIEDFSKSENSPLYIGFIETGAIIGPLIGLLLASFCANIYVDTGSVSTGIYNLPPICIGYIAGGLIMKKFKITVKQAAHIGCWLSVIEYLLYFLCFLATCDNSPVAGITTSYEGIQQDLYVGNKILADCNTDCNCPTKTWDPVCGDNGLSYMSACLAGCETSSGTGLNMVFQNCSCIRTSGNSSAVLGLCDKGHDCSMMLQYFLILSTISSFIYSLAAIPGYMVLLRHIYLGLPAALRGSSFIPAFLILILLRKHHLPGENDPSGTELAVMKVTEKEKECKDVHQNSKVLNDEEMKAKL
ncbi:Solute carrier organic anion transporter family member 1A2 [Sciurus carolinensis]|uniref:Solute carrier organic anion transporter family member 1A2 n=1 Tax=Sciurus carolinensis TaxID=30640 RepID=A0AA41MDA6_SCICA|nr:Solute carrier organic anion transporter family member 1A2 [Sciurus carolinensis]